MVLKLLKRLGNLVPKPVPVRHLTILIQVPKIPDGVVEVGPRLVLHEYFITPVGKDMTAFTDKADVEKTAAAAMKMLRLDPQPNDFEIVRVQSDHKASKYCVVWFPKAEEFSSHAVLYEHRIRLLTPKMTTLHEAIRLAEAQRKSRLAASSE
jgi:hypothetical protein